MKIQKTKSFNGKMSSGSKVKHKLRLLFFYLICLNLNCSFAMIQVNGITVLKEVFYKFIDECMVKNTKVISIKELYTHDKVNINYMDIQTEFVKMLDAKLLIISSLNAPNAITTPTICNIISLDSYEGLEILAPGKITENVDIYDYYLIIWQHVTTTNETLENSLQKVVNYFWKYSIKQILIVALMPAPQEPRIFTFSLFAMNACRQPRLKERPNNYFRNIRRLFYHTMGNWHGCPLRVLSWNSPPYVMIAAKNASHRGIEWQLITEVAKRFNATIEIVPASTSFDTYHNGTFTQSAQLLSDRVVDMAMGNLARTLDIHKYFSPSTYYMQSSIVPYIMPLWKRPDAADLLLRPFAWPVWFSIIVCILFSMSLIRPMTALTYLQSILSIVLAVPTNFTRRWRIRYNLMLISLLMLVLRSCYLGVMFNMLSQPQPLLLRNLKDLSHYNFTAVLTPYFNYFLNELDISTNASVPLILDHSSFITTFELLERQPQQRYVTFSSTLLQQYHYTKLKRKPKLVSLSSDVMYRHHNCIYFRKHTFFQRFFNVFIGIARDIGMLTNIRRQYVDASFKSQSVKYYVDYNHSAKPLALAQYLGFFQVIFVIWFFSIIVFILEIIWYRYHNTH